MSEQSLPPPRRRHPVHHEHAGQPPERIELTDEEKAVLVECRRNSVARGAPLGVGCVLLLRWFITQGRVPLHVQRWAGLYYTGAFFAGFFTGIGSYRQRCYDKIMALQNSALGDQVRENMARRKGYGSWEHGATTQPAPTSPSVPSRGTTQGHASYQAPPTSPPSSSQEGGAPVYPRGSRSKREVYGDSDSPSIEPSEVPLVSDQPDAFGSGSTYTPQHLGSQDSTPSAPRRKSFDEIREESRRRHLQQSFPNAGRNERVWSEGDKAEGELQAQTQRQSGRGQGTAKAVHTNKYGDVVED